MKLQQLRYIREIQRNGYNISLTSEKLFTSQPGISKQVALLEGELGVQIFERQGKHLSGATEIGQQIIQEASKMLEIEEKIKAISASVTAPDRGRMNIHTTNAIAKFLLPETVRYFMNKYPKVSLHMGTIEPDSRGNTLPTGPYDFSVVAQEIDEQADLTVLPAYKWSLSLILPLNHPLADVENITLEQLAQEKLISYELKSTGRMAIDDAFTQRGLTPTYIVTAMDAEVIKEYVRLGVGVGLIASVATHTMSDSIVVRSLEGLVPDCYAWLCYSKNLFLQQYMYDFIAKFAPHLTRTMIEQTAHLSKAELTKWFEDMNLMTYR
ncbi:MULTISPECIES: LysR substrate-binding domain-containing protein [Vibrio]|uniref:LysR substrate-binding domain-containing protein n=3 Tax=Unclassified Bacteria TaxID=49928 RepID=A0AAU6UQE5_UNCXX|nr:MULTISPECIES: LysR substrate-binding domain-containing protein [Vibrio]EKO3558700.1 LysR family transcriptional regulator [Vibrio metschnikovii]EKO3576474.1 LysR family transcriptional regulator [Vibrio metschnikovii]EKO3578387.1 LysR family transcriptional regulator [Vibrio metschnikovii]EKO3583461.1 LysR family transcriptional regulator [Vibrio metschnikovii]EKO3599016.1 LysR family transcriptional regulator [Vibrio metschnikovii]